MNKRAYIFYFIVFILGFSVAYLSGVKMGTYSYPQSSEKEVNVNAQQETETSTEGYWVKISDDKIVVYHSDAETVVAETDIDISEFSEKEKKILENGIYLENAEELFKYLEANTS
jgi:hypothetical protein